MEQLGLWVNLCSFYFIFTESFIINIIIYYKYNFWIVLRYKIWILYDCIIWYDFRYMYICNDYEYGPKADNNRMVQPSRFIILWLFGSILWEHAILVADTYVKSEKFRGIYTRGEAAIFRMFISSNRPEMMLGNVPC